MIAQKMASQHIVCLFVDKHQVFTLNQRTTNLFLKMLLQLPKNGFQKDSIVLKTQDYLKALNVLPIEIANQAHEIEIIPYEKLWQIVLNTI